MKIRPSTWWRKNAEIGTGQTDHLFGQWSRPQSGEIVPVKRDASLARTDTNTVPATGADVAFSSVQMFALVSAADPATVTHYGIEVGTGAYTFRTDANGHTNFGHWRSMQSAFEKLDRMAGPEHNLALVLFDSIPVMALAPLLQGWPGLTGVANSSPDQVANAQTPALERAHDADDA